MAIKVGKFNPHTRPACPDLAGPRLSSQPACYLPAIALAQARRTGRHIAMADRWRAGFADYTDYSNHLKDIEKIKYLF
jgi:hypothetical protein